MRLQAAQAVGAVVVVPAAEAAALAVAVRALRTAAAVAIVNHSASASMLITRVYRHEPEEQQRKSNTAIQESSAKLIRHEY